ncbi:MULTISPECIES: hydroxyisourate hydrolase [Streptomyces]|uniref:hydroxyisourate hydrolase n=1 Tax=Streptomyces TaxID=1883 RepID=UPI000CD4E143|nr:MULTISPECIES: hydroxyisourate hydrolase [Streptomyces]
MSLAVQILDHSFGVPATDVEVLVRRRTEDGWQDVARGLTGEDGRLTVLPDGQCPPGLYQLVCDLDAYYAILGAVALFPRAVVEVRVSESEPELVLPVVVSAHSVLVYRGS